MGRDSHVHILGDFFIDYVVLLLNTAIFDSPEKALQEFYAGMSTNLHFGCI